METTNIKKLGNKLKVYIRETSLNTRIILLKNVDLPFDLRNDGSWSSWPVKVAHFVKYVSNWTSPPKPS